jgi:hypothetical protein
MKSSQFSSTRRRLLTLFGLGAAGAVVASDKVFAKQFCGEAAEMGAPKMVYDPELQMMVDPATRAPIYDDAKSLRLAQNPTITAGCKDCPKRDD